MFNFEELFKTFFNINAQFDDIIEEPIDNSTTRHLEPPNRTYEIGQKLSEKETMKDVVFVITVKYVLLFLSVTQAQSPASMHGFD